jgi:hypothetical protein
MALYYRSSRDIRAVKTSNKVNDSRTGQKSLKRLKTYCICNGPSEGLMIECETCRDWFHIQCVQIEEKNIPNHYNCVSCSPTSQLEETIVEALSLLAEKASRQNKLKHKNELSDRDEESMEEEIPVLTSDDKDCTPYKTIKKDFRFFSPKKEISTNEIIQDKTYSSDISDSNALLALHNAKISHYSGSHLSDNSGSEDSSPPIDPPSSPSSPSSPSVTKRGHSHSVTKTYTRKSKKQIAFLEKYYEENHSPDANRIHMIALESGLPEQKVSRWFYDKRRRSKQLNSDR